MSELSKWCRLGRLWFWVKLDDWTYPIHRKVRSKMIQSLVAMEKDGEEDLTSNPDRARLMALLEKEKKA